MREMSVILPVYNGNREIIKTLDKVHEFSKKNPSLEFIFVDDGSTDNTKNIIEKKMSLLKNRKIKLVSYKNNKGKGNAVKIGAKYAKKELICFIDSDLAYSLEHLNLMAQKLEKFDVVIGCRRLAENYHTVKFSRKFIGRTFNIFSRLILGLRFRDMQAGLKGFRTDAIKEIFPKQTINGFSFDPELLFIARKKKFSIGEIPAKVSSEHYHKISRVNIIIDSFKMFCDLIKIRLNYLFGRYN